MAATLIASYEVNSAGDNTSALTTPSFTPSNGEVLVVKSMTWSTDVAAGAVSGGSQTYTTRVTAQPGGFNSYARVDTAVVSGSPGSMTITQAAPASSCRHMLVVERWTGQLDATPAVNSTINGSGAPSANITTEAAGSAVSWCSVDTASQDPASRAYRLSATEDGLYDGHVGANAVFYSAYAGSGGSGVGAAGTYAMGMTAPGSQTWVLAGIEIQSAASGTNANAESAAGTGTANNATPAVKPNAGSAAATGIANQPTPRIAATTATATGTGTANNPAPRVSPNATAAAATGLALAATIALGVPAGVATATGTAYNATISTSAQANAQAGAASAIGTAYNASIAITVRPTTADAVGIANQPVADNGTETGSFTLAGPARTDWHAGPTHTGWKAGQPHA